MLKRIANAGVNFVVLGVSVVIFLAAFLLLTGLGAAQRPPTIRVLAVTRDLNIGDVITPADLVEKTVFQDDNASLYIPSEEAKDVVGDVAAMPIFRNAIIAKAGEGARLSAALSEYPGYSLFPLPLDAMNVVAPELKSFLPGDLIGITVVITSRPQPVETATPQPEILFTPPQGSVPTPTPLPEEASRSEALARSYPPLAKDLFPQGVRVIAVQGLSQTTSSSDGTTGSSSDYSSLSDFSQVHMLILLVPNESREVLSLAFQQGDRLIVSLMARGDDASTAGFTYWDFEDLFKADREKALSGGR